MILLTDANILITLFDVDEVSILSRIAPTEILDVVLAECEHESQPGLNQAVTDAGIKVIESDVAWVPPAKQMMNGGKLAAVLAQAAVALGREVLEVGHDDLAELAGRARHQGDATPLGDVAGHRGALTDGLVVGVGVDQQQALGRKVAHASTVVPGTDAPARRMSGSR